MNITQSSTGRPVEFVILSPAGAGIPAAFHSVAKNDSMHATLLTSMQRFRAGVYLQDGAVRPEHLTVDGRHSLAIDEESWHVLTLNEDREICACLRLHQERTAPHFDALPVSRSALGHCPTWGGRLRHAVESEIAIASAAQIRFGDIGGWAIAPERRCTLEPLRTILAGFGLAQQLGGLLGIATATCKHGSATILRKLGLSPLRAAGETFPVYYDPHYRSEMEVLRFDSRRPNPKYCDWIGQLRLLLSTAPVVIAQHRIAGAAMRPAAAPQMWDRSRIQPALRFSHTSWTLR